jgi:hypothetical protein
MSPPNAVKPASASAENGLLEADRLASATCPSNRTTDSTAQALNDKLDEARDNLDRRTDMLDVVAEWTKSLRTRIARSKLRFENLSTDPTEIDALVVEAAELRRCVTILNWRDEK